MEIGDVGILRGSGRLNTTVSWLLILFVLGVASVSLLRGELLWSGLVLAVAVVSVYPSVRYRNVSAVIHWKILLLALLPVVGQTVGAPFLTTRLGTYISVAAVALIVVAEIRVFTSTKIPDYLTAVLVAVATVASAGIWGVVSWLSDVYLGTSMVPTEEDLMWGFVTATAAGLVAGVSLTFYFRRGGSNPHSSKKEEKEVGHGET
ncbi:hypothetical protein ACEU6E_03285 [Halorutilales archaeon Cl-col2-1]